MTAMRSETAMASLLIVRDVDRGDADAVLNLADGVAHLDAQLRVEVGERLVHQQHVRLDDDGAGERDALLLTAGKALGQAVGILGDLHGPKISSTRRLISFFGRWRFSRPKATFSRTVMCGKTA